MKIIFCLSLLKVFSLHLGVYFDYECGTFALEIMYTDQWWLLWLHKNYDFLW